MKPYIFFDIEATSNSVDDAQILEIAAIKEGSPPFVAYLRVDPAPDEESGVWNIVAFSKAEYEARAKDPEEALRDFLDYVGDRPLAGHNVLAYDLPVLQRALERFGLPLLKNRVLDTLRLAHLIFPTPDERLNGYGLSDLYQYFTERLPERPHEALSDVETNVEVARCLREKARNVPQAVRRLWAALSLEEARFLGTTSREGEELRDLHDALGRDAEVAWVYSEGGPFPRVWENPDAFTGLLGERRESQIKMMQSVAKALGEGEALLIEAPTGTGKTRGYLFPVLALQARDGEEAPPYVIATHTKLLQEQVMAELRSIAAKDYAVSAVNLKTARDYLCLDALKEAFEERGSLDGDARAMVGVLLHYASQGGHDLEALPAFWRSRPGFREIRYRVEANPRRCGRGLEHRHCAYTLVNDRKKRARIWVTNQAWLLAHQTGEAREEEEACCRLIIDEAHNLEGQATASFSLQIEGEELLARLKRLYDPEKKTGLLRDRSRLQRLLGDEPGEALLKFAEEFRVALIYDLLRKLKQLGHDLSIFIKQYGQGEPRYGVRLDLAPSFKNKNEWPRITQSLDEVRRGLKELKTHLEQVVPRDSRLHYRLDPLYDALARFSRLSWMVREAVEGRLDEREWVLELVLTESTWAILAQPVDLVKHLSPLWTKVQGPVLTSATLDLGDNFTYIKRALGLKNAKTEKLPGNLPYGRAHLFVPGHLPEFRGSLQKRFLSLYHEELATLLPLAKRSLTLFNATERMEKLGIALKKRLEADNQPLYFPLTRKEREDAARKMRAQPTHPGHTFGSRTFMEGIDLPNLKLVNLERIPFPVPSRLLEARGRLAEEEGLDPWQDVYLPKAILSFVQAFGRLIRDNREVAGDGVFILWDKRLVNAFYQERFLDALPEGVKKHFPKTRAEFYDKLAEILRVDRGLLPSEELFDRALKKLRAIREGGGSPLDKAVELARGFWEGVDLEKEAEREAKQRQAIAAALEGKNLFVFLPTGYGKSLTFQLPALVEGGLTLVISPLKALMADQVSKLQDRGLPAAKVDSSMPAAERGAVFDEVRAGRIHLLYVSPERAVRDQGFRRLLEDMRSEGRLKRFVFDEAHAIWEWGQGFRPDYLQATTYLREVFPEVPISALTATAVPELRRDLYEILRLEEDEVEVVTAHPDRPEIRYYTKRTRGEDAPLKKLQELTQLIEHLESKAGKNSSVIVYVATKRMAERLAWALGRLGYRAEAYHAGLSDLLRSEVQSRFENGETPIVVATKAFGMGIDKADVRAVVHFQPPENLEAYLQESGRAGRDGQEAYALLCHAAGDWKLLQWMATNWSYDENHVDGLLDLLEEGPYWGYTAELLKEVNRLANEGRDEEKRWEIGALELNQILSRAAEHGVIEFDFLPGKVALLAEDCKALGGLGQVQGGRCEVDLTKLDGPEDADRIAGDLYRDWKNGRIRLLRFYEPSIRVVLKDRKKETVLRSWTEERAKKVQERLEKVQAYAKSPGCLRGFLLEYLGASGVECSGCLYHDDGMPPWHLSYETPLDVIQNAYQPREVVLEFLSWLQDRWESWQEEGDKRPFNGYGATLITKTLLGEEYFWVGNERRRLRSWLVQSHYFGKLAFVKNKEIQRLLDRLSGEGLVEKRPYKNGAVYRITNAGRAELERLRRRVRA